MQRAMSQFRLTVEEALTSVELAVREERTTYDEMTSKYQAMIAAQNEAEYLLDRWHVMPGLDDSAAILLEDLLDAQERLADEEFNLAQAQVNYALSLTRLKRETGTLLQLTKQEVQE